MNEYLEIMHELYDNPYASILKRKTLAFDLSKFAIYAPKHEPPSIYGIRHGLVHHYSFAVPDDKALDILAAHGPIVELGAGTGYWAHLLTERGVEVIALDNNSWCNAWKKQWFPVLTGDVDCLPKSKKYTLFLCWPTAELAAHALEAFKGEYIIYIGDDGCCVDDKFLDRITRHFSIVEHHQIPYWIGLHDRLIVFKRKMSLLGRL